MSAITAHVMRRSFEFASDLSEKRPGGPGGPGKPDAIHPPGALVALAIFSVFVFALIIGAVSIALFYLLGPFC